MWSNKKTSKMIPRKVWTAASVIGFLALFAFYQICFHNIFNIERSPALDLYRWDQLKYIYSLKSFLLTFLFDNFSQGIESLNFTLNQTIEVIDKERDDEEENGNEVVNVHVTAIDEATEKEESVNEVKNVHINANYEVTVKEENDEVKNVNMNASDEVTENEKNDEVKNVHMNANNEVTMKEDDDEEKSLHMSPNNEVTEKEEDGDRTSHHPHSDLFTRNLTLVDIKSFKFIINNDICNVGPVAIVTIVHSSAENKAARDIIRFSSA